MTTSQRNHCLLSCNSFLLPPTLNSTFLIQVHSPPIPHWSLSQILPIIVPHMSIPLDLPEQRRPGRSTSICIVERSILAPSGASADKLHKSIDCGNVHTTPERQPLSSQMLAINWCKARAESKCDEGFCCDVIVLTVLESTVHRLRRSERAVIPKMCCV